MIRVVYKIEVVEYKTNHFCHILFVTKTLNIFYTNSLLAWKMLGVFFLVEKTL